jgi:hypothetical protein
MVEKFFQERLPRSLEEETLLLGALFATLLFLFLNEDGFDGWGKECLGFKVTITHSELNQYFPER